MKSRINRGREELMRLLLRAQQPARGGRAPVRPRGRRVRARGPEVMMMQLAVDTRAT